MQSSQNAHFLFQSEKEIYILSGLETSLSEVTLSERNVSGVFLSCAVLLGIPAGGGWSFGLPEAQVGPVAGVSITEKLAPLQSVPSVMPSSHFAAAHYTLLLLQTHL